MAGMSLGFNLKESLAAIDQWVEEMDSDESTSRDGLDGEDDDSVEDLDLHNMSHKSLITSYADVTPDKLQHGSSTPRSEADPHITHTPGEVGGGPIANATALGGGNRPGSKGSSRSGSRGSSRADSFAPEGGGARILSRDVIISMCHGGDRLSERDSSSESLAAKAGEDGLLSGVDNIAKTGDSDPREREPPARLPTATESREKGVPLKKMGEREGSMSLSTHTEIIDEDPQGSSPPRVEDATEDTKGPATSMTDAELVTMLKMRPKAVPALRTRSSYCQFFNGISKARMIRLLEKAYEETEDEEERTAKVEKRVLILDGCFA